MKDANTIASKHSVHFIWNANAHKESKRTFQTYPITSGVSRRISGGLRANLIENLVFHFYEGTEKWWTIMEWIQTLVRLNLWFDLLAGYSGSDLQALCEEAALMPIRELGENILTIKANQVTQKKDNGIVLSITWYFGYFSFKRVYFTIFYSSFVFVIC